MDSKNEKGRAIALLPIGIFLLIFLGSGILTGDFYAMPAIVAFLIALLVVAGITRDVVINAKADTDRRPIIILDAGHAGFS